MAQTIDVDLINAFWQATTECFDMMGGIVCTRGSMRVKSDAKMLGNYYSVIGLSNGLIGNCAVAMYKDEARFIIENMFGETDVEESMLLDGVGEITNLIAGGGKRLLASQRLYNFDISPPTSLVNRDASGMQVHNPDGTICIMLECMLSSLNKSFLIELAFETEDSEALHKRKRA